MRNQKLLNLMIQPTAIMKLASVLLPTTKHSLDRTIKYSLNRTIKHSLNKRIKQPMRTTIKYSLSTRNKNTKQQQSFSQFDSKFNGNHQSQSFTKNTFLGSQKIDNLTQQTILQYEQKLKNIRNFHQSKSQQIQHTYQTIISQLQTSINKNTNIKHNKNNNYNLNNKFHNNLNNNHNSNASKLSEQEQQILQQQLQNMKLQKMNKLLNNQQQLKNKIQQLTTQYTGKIKLSRKQYQLQYIKKYILENAQQFTPNKKDKESKAQTIAQKVTKGIFLEELIAQATNSNKYYGNQSSYIPNNLVLKKLYFKHNNKQSPVLLAGVQEGDQDHCTYLKTLIQRLKIKDVLSMISPDMPYFIKTQKSFLSQWQQFLKVPSPSFKFYLNPNPRTLNDITLSSSYIPLVIDGMTKSKSFYKTTFSLMQMNDGNFKYNHQPLFTGLISSMVQNVYFCDYPFLKQRQMIAMNVSLADLRQLMKRFAYYKKHERQHFSAQLLLPKSVVEKKYRHIIKVAKTISLAKQSIPILICPASIAQVMSQQWQKSLEQYLQFDYTQNSYLLDMELNKQGIKEILYIQFIEKLVILDIILCPLIDKYFVKYGSFPYSCRNTVGGKQNLNKVFLLWKHYHSLYSNAVSGNFTSQQDKWQKIL